MYDIQNVYSHAMIEGSILYPLTANSRKLDIVVRSGVVSKITPDPSSKLFLDEVNTKFLRLRLDILDDLLNWQKNL